MVKAVRGAVSVEEDTIEVIKDAVELMITTLEEKNGFSASDLISIQFSVTPDLMAVNPAAALRKVKDGYGMVPLFCVQEPSCIGSSPMIIRTLITFNTENRIIVPVYLGRAAALRPDIK